MAPEVHGTSDEAFSHIRKLFQDNLDSGAAVGASLAVSIDGKTVVDIYGGHADSERTKPWTRDTITNVWSITKLVSALAALILVDRGQLDLNAKVSKYWPEFGTNGKEDILVLHILSHTSGVSGWDPPFKSVEEGFLDRETGTNRLAAQVPFWEPGTASGYHLSNYGHLIAEVIRRITGKTLTEFVQTEISIPLSADFQIGARESDWHRVADIIKPEVKFPKIDPSSVAFKTFTSSPSALLLVNTPAWRRAEWGGGNGHSNARGLLDIFNVIALNGQQPSTATSTAPPPLISPDTISKIFDEQANGVDLVLGMPIRWGNGFVLNDCEAASRYSLPEKGKICFWVGWGGAIVVMDLERRMCISYVMNKMAPDFVGSEVTKGYVEAIYDIVGR